MALIQFLERIANIVALGRLIEHFKSHEGVEFVTMAQMSDEFKSKNKPAPGALMPAAAGAMLKK